LWSSDFDRETEALLQENFAELGTLIEIDEDTISEIKLPSTEHLYK
jgi:ureidoglycolate hydrolase